MLLTLAVAAAVCQTASVADFFPLEPGSKRIYEQTRGKTVSQQIDTVGTPVEIEGQMLTPVVTTASGQQIATSYYRIAGDTVLSVGIYKKGGKEACLDPIPILKVGEKRSTWVHLGMTSWFGSPYPIKVKTTATVKGKRKVFGKEVEVIEVRYETTLGSGEKIADVHSTMTALYAKGIGLYEQKDESYVSKVKTVQILKLIDYTPGKPSEAPKETK